MHSGASGVACLERVCGRAVPEERAERSQPGVLEGSGEGGTGVSPVNGGTEMTGETPVPLLLLPRNFGP